jgi:hypothetical protein
MVLCSLIIGHTVRADEPKTDKSPITEKEWQRFVEKMNPFGLVQRIREAQARAAAAENLKKIGKALEEYQKKNPKVDMMVPQWWEHILPYIEQDNRNPFNYLTSDWSLGVRFEGVSDALRAQLNLANDKGLLITEVDANTSADKAGLKKHDIILQWDGKDVASKPAEFSQMLRSVTEKKTVTAKVMRGGKEVAIKGIELQPGMGQSIRTYILPDSIRDGTSNTTVIGDAYSRQWLNPSTNSFYMTPSQRSEVQSKIMTTTFRQEDRFTARYQEGSLSITITGQMKKDVAEVKAVKVIDGAIEHRYESIDKTPEEYRDKARDLVKAAEKNQDRIEIQKGQNPFGNW